MKPAPQQYQPMGQFFIGSFQGKRALMEYESWFVARFVRYMP